MPQTMWKTPVVPIYEPGPELRKAVKAMEAAEAKAKALVDAARKKLHQAVADEVAKPTRPADVARFMKWHPSYVRRIAKAHGVAPHIDVEPPRRKPSTPDH